MRAQQLTKLHEMKKLELKNDPGVCDCVCVCVTPELLQLIVITENPAQL